MRSESINPSWRAVMKVEGRPSYQEIAPENLAAIRRLHRQPKQQKGEEPKHRLTHGLIADKLNELGFTTFAGKTFTVHNVSKILLRSRKKSDDYDFTFNKIIYMWILNL